MNKAIHTISRFKILLPVATLSLLTILSAFALSSPRSSAETRKLNAAVHVPDTCSMNAVDSGTATVDNPYEMIGGMYVDNISSTTINITCNDRNGYSLYAVGYGNGDVGNTNMIGRETGDIIPTGTVSDGSVSNWSFRLAPISGVYTPSILSDTNGSFATNHIIPSTDTKIATFTGDIDASAESSLTATYAVGVEHYQTPDIYTGQVRYTLVHPNYTNADGTTESYAGPLTFANASSMTIDGVTYTSSSEAPDLTHGEHTISAGTFPTGYEFGNWSATGGISITDSTSATTTINVISAGTLSLNGKLKTFTVTIATNNATSVNIDGATYSGGAAPSLTYGSHAISGTYPSGYEFDSWSSTGSISVSSTSTASTTMTVSGAGTLTLNAKSSCVAIPTSTGIMQTYSLGSISASSICDGSSTTLEDNRDNNQYLVAKLADGHIWMLDNLRLGSGSTISLTSSNTNLPSGVTWTLPAGITSGFESYTAAQINVASKDTVASAKYGSGSGKIGVYYNYCAASAGGYCAAVNSGSGDNSKDRDVCPKGWRMPTGGISGEYKALYTAYSSDATNFRAALSTPLSGYFYKSSASSQGSYGYFWSSTYGGSSTMYRLYVDSSGVNPTYTSNRIVGYSVRCILK